MQYIFLLSLLFSNVQTYPQSLALAQVLQLFELKKSNTSCAFPQGFKKTVTSLNTLASLVLN